MKLILFSIAIAFLIAVVVAQTPARPKIPETFYATLQIRIENRQNRERDDGEGTWAVNHMNGTAVEHWRFEREHLNLYELQRYDMGSEYIVMNNTRCQKRALRGKIPDVWAWIMNATYVGKRTIERDTVDIWEAKENYVTITVAVLANDVNHPVWLWELTTERNVSVYFNQFNARTPSAFYFAVPRECANVTLPSFEEDTEPKTQCDDRKNIMARAQVWVDNKVPYNQGGTYQGYREDCSGYVSMAWAVSKPGYVTQTLPQISKRITKDQLMEGDVLLYTAEHVVIFGGWTNSGKTEYMAYEETKPGEGTVKRVTPYPYWYDTANFLPYRYNNVC